MNGIERQPDEFWSVRSFSRLWRGQVSNLFSDPQGPVFLLALDLLRTASAVEVGFSFSGEPGLRWVSGLKRIPISTAFKVYS